MKILIVTLLITISLSTNIRAQSLYLKFDYRTVGGHDAYSDEDFLLMIPDSLKHEVDLPSYLLERPTLFLNLLNDYDRRIYYNADVASDIMLTKITNQNTSMYIDTFTRKIKPYIIVEYEDLERTLDKISYQDSVIAISNGPEIRISVVKLPCLNIRKFTFSKLTKKCLFFFLKDGIIRYREPSKDCDTNIVYLE